MRSRRYSTISWFSIGVGSMTRRRRASRVTTGRTAFWDHGPRSVVRNRPRGFSSGRHRPIELFPTASKTTSYWWSSFVKSTASRVDDPVGPQPAHELDVRRPAHGGHPRAEVREQLDGGAADRARRAVDEHVLAAADAGLPDDGQRVVRTLGARGDVLEGQTAGDCRDRPVRRDRQELGMRAEPRAVAEHPVSGGEPRHPRADGLDDPRELVAENRRPRPDESGERADEERLRRALTGL